LLAAGSRNTRRAGHGELGRDGAADRGEGCPRATGLVQVVDDGWRESDHVPAPPRLSVHALYATLLVWNDPVARSFIFLVCKIVSIWDVMFQHKLE
jgi:hypothetical protein